MDEISQNNYLAHHGILGQKWGVRRFQNEDGTRTAAGKKRRADMEGSNKLSSDKIKKAAAISLTVAASIGLGALAVTQAKRIYSKHSDEISNITSKVLSDTTKTVSSIKETSGTVINKGKEFAQDVGAVAKGTVQTAKTLGTAVKNTAKFINGTAKVINKTASVASKGYQKGKVIAKNAKKEFEPVIKVAKGAANVLSPVANDAYKATKTVGKDLFNAAKTVSGDLYQIGKPLAENSSPYIENGYKAFKKLATGTYNDIAKPAVKLAYNVGKVTVQSILRQI